MSHINIAICQMMVSDNKVQNLNEAQEMIEKSVVMGADIVVLPEMFNCPYQTSLFPDYAEDYPGESTTLLSNLAKKHEILLVAGSIPEKDENNKIYNTSYTFNDKGELINKYRKIHLFDIDIADKITFRESDTLSAGDSLNIAQYKELCFASIICYDIRFPELTRIASLQGAQLIFVPASFNMTTGPLHWELLMRSRAMDNQVYVITASSARNLKASYQAWGHSMIVDPWGQIVIEADEKEDILLANIDLSLLDNVRKEIPVLKQRRKDLYSLEMK